MEPTLLIFVLNVHDSERHHVCSVFTQCAKFIYHIKGVWTFPKNTTPPDHAIKASSISTQSPCCSLAAKRAGSVWLHFFVCFSRFLSPLLFPNPLTTTGRVIEQEEQQLATLLVQERRYELKGHGSHSLSSLATAVDPPSASVSCGASGCPG